MLSSLSLCLFGFVIFNNENSSCFHFFGLRFTQSYLSLFFSNNHGWLMKYRRLQHIEYTSSSRPVFTSADKIKHFFIFSTLCAEGVKKPSIYAQHRVFRGSMCVCVRRYCLFFLYFMLFLFSRFFFSCFSFFCRLNVVLPIQTACVINLAQVNFKINVRLPKHFRHVQLALLNCQLENCPGSVWIA